MQATCTHLGCRTSYERRTKRILCPRHGGAYNTRGEVIVGPPPSSLHALPARVENGQVLVALGTCAGCHKIAGDGGETGPDVSHVGSRRDVASIRKLIQDPTAEYPDAFMPTFGERLSAAQIEVLAKYLAARR